MPAETAAVLGYYIGLVVGVCAALFMVHVIRPPKEKKL